MAFNLTTLTCPNCRSPHCLHAHDQSDQYYCTRCGGTFTSTFIAAHKEPREFKDQYMNQPIIDTDARTKEMVRDMERALCNPGELIRKGMERYTGIVPLPPPSERHNVPRVHILYQGEMMCGSQRGRPVDWTKGHEWVSLEGYEQGAKINCDDCYAHLKLRISRGEIK